MLLLFPSCQKCRLTFEDVFLSMLSIVTRSVNAHEGTGDLEDGIVGSLCLEMMEGMNNCSFFRDGGVSMSPGSNLCLILCDHKKQLLLQFLVRLTTSSSISDFN